MESSPEAYRNDRKNIILGAKMTIPVLGAFLVGTELITAASDALHDNQISDNLSQAAQTGTISAVAVGTLLLLDKGIDRLADRINARQQR